MDADARRRECPDVRWSATALVGRGSADALMVGFSSAEPSHLPARVLQRGTAAPYVPLVALIPTPVA